MNGPLFFWFRDKLLMLFKPCRYWISLRAAWLRRSESPENCQPQTGGYRWFRMVGKCYHLRKPFFFFVALLWQVAWTAGGRRAQKLWGPGYDAMARTEKKQHWGKKMEKENTNLGHPLEQFFPSLCVRRAHMITYAYYAYWSNTEVKQLCRHKA